VSRVKQIENELEKLSIAELNEVREWLEHFVEDRMGFAHIQERPEDTVSQVAAACA